MSECDYCREDIILEDYKASQSNIRSLEIVFRPEFRDLDVRTETEDGYHFTFGIDTRFNYCPYCGGKLKGA